MQSKNIFIPHEISYPLLWTFDFALPLILKKALNIDGIDIDEEDKTRLRSLSSKRILYISNHPSTIEPAIAYYVANVMGSRFHYMASRNVFNWGLGLAGEIIKRVGAFSVLAGGADKNSIKMARSVLAQKSGKLAIYPEGMLTGENDNLIPFMPGVAQIGLWGLEDALKKDSQADIQVLSVFVKYVLSGTPRELHKEIETSIQKIEKKLNITSNMKNNLLNRFIEVGKILLENAERDYNIKPEPNWDYNYRAGRVRHEALNQAAHKLGIKFSEKDDAIHKIREIFTVIDELEAGLRNSKASNLSKDDLSKIKKEVERAYIFLIIKVDYLVSYPSAERFMEWIYRFENVLFGETKLRPRRAKVTTFEPFGLMEYYPSYKRNKKETVIKVTERLRHDMEALMTNCISLTKPMISTI
ncbi:MAG: 1-acyl-sn-glycerol-3-phosphate acyltransferase [Leptospiraceae bacterium]|nr:1-acyl-sn-glycerol-3-phosphate acyltransferase [Leptospiraceae bacterium]MCP5493124.1 1-acyl-sn-glycerol-3-phosphate acyltransferase [Leptospiraceae bacterium]